MSSWGVVGVASTLTANKRRYLEACMEAGARLSSHGQVREVRVVGDGPERRGLEQTAARLMADSPRLLVRFVGAEPDPWPGLDDCQLVIGMGMVALEAALQGHNVLCASSDGIGGRLTAGSYQTLSQTNFTGRLIRPLDIESLVSEVEAAMALGVDPTLAALVESIHVHQSAERWIGLWDRLAA